MPSCLSFGPHLFPVFTALFLPLSFITTYIIAVLEDHVEPGFPYISDTGAVPPESCVFGQLLSIGAIFIGICVYIRWRQISLYCEDFGLLHPGLKRINIASSVIGFIAACGVSVVGNFQETNLLAMHVVGAVMAFGMGNVYAWMQVYLSYRVYPTVGRLWLCRVRIFFSFLSTTCFFITMITEHYARQEFHGKDPKKWYPEDGGFGLHILSTVCEWAMSVFFCLYFITFSCEFSQFKIQHMTVIPHPINRSLDDEPLTL